MSAWRLLGPSWERQMWEHWWRQAGCCRIDPAGERDESRRLILRCAADAANREVQRLLPPWDADGRIATVLSECQNAVQVLVARSLGYDCAGVVQEYAVGDPQFRFRMTCCDGCRDCEAAGALGRMDVLVCNPTTVWAHLVVVFTRSYR